MRHFCTFTFVVMVMMSDDNDGNNGDDDDSDDDDSDGADDGVCKDHGSENGDFTDKNIDLYDK